MMRSAINTLLTVCCALTVQIGVAQPGGAPAPAPRAAAPFELEGYWTAVVNEDWMFRMVTPPAGEYRGVPLNRAARELADAWNPEADERLGEGCRAYGAPAIMRVPGRILVEWTDEATLSVRTEAGEQTRIFRFGAQPVTEPSRQGASVARWELAGGSGARHGNLRVATTNLLPGYLRKNGVPYSANARVSEFWSVYPAPNGDTWLVVTTEVQDPQYLTQTFITSSHFKKLDDSDGRRYWKPAVCSAR
jgi:hypothetical protein